MNFGGNDMIKVIGVRFRKAGKIYYFDPDQYDIQTNDYVIVETVRGIEYGKVVKGEMEVADDDVVHPLKKVMRMATQEDHDKEKANKEEEKRQQEFVFPKSKNIS